jgi:ribosomal protein S18 acetylase RimI-like enzyme
VNEDDFDLEDEYGELLDLIQENIAGLRGMSIEHHGVKGMKWGVRKDRSKSTREPLKSLGPDSVSRKTASGEIITLQKVKPNKLVKFLGRVSKGYREGYSKRAELNILDGQGKKVGEASVQKKNSEDLYLNWLGIDKSARGKGYATAVMQAGRDFGKQQGFKRMTLEVPGNSPDARHIYEKLGFKVVKEGNPKDDPIWGGLTDMVYEFDAAHSQLAHYAVGGSLNPRKILVDKLIIDRGKQRYSKIRNPEDAKRAQNLLRHMGIG